MLYRPSNIVPLALLVTLACTACTELPNAPPDATADLGADVTLDVAGELQPELPTTPDVGTDTPDPGPHADAEDVSPPDVEDTSPPDVPTSNCPGGCDEGEVCLAGGCVGSCGTTPLSDLLGALAPSVKAVDNICKDNSDVWAWAIGQAGAVYEVRSQLVGTGSTRVGLWSFNWWDGVDGVLAAATIADSVVSGTVELWQVFPGRFLKLNEAGDHALWGFALGAASGSLNHTALTDGANTVIDAPGVYGGTVFSSFLLATGNGLASTSAGPDGYYFHTVLGIGGTLVDGLGSAVGSIDVHGGEVLLVSGYSEAWPDCGGVVPETPAVGQRTYALPLSLLVERYTAATLPIDVVCEGQQVQLPTDHVFLADGRIATRDVSEAFELTGLSVHYWAMNAAQQLELGDSVAITVGSAFDAVRADPHSTQLLLQYADGYLVVEGPPTQDPVVPLPPSPTVDEDPELQPEAGPEPAPETLPDTATDAPPET